MAQAVTLPPTPPTPHPSKQAGFPAVQRVLCISSPFEAAVGSGLWNGINVLKGAHDLSDGLVHNRKMGLLRKNVYNTAPAWKVIVSTFSYLLFVNAVLREGSAKGARGSLVFSWVLLFFCGQKQGSKY
jgi:hypothetical protein